MYLIAFYIAAIVADIYAFGAVGMVTATIVLALLGMKKARRTFGHSLGMGVAAVLFTVVTTPPFVQFLLTHGSEEVQQDVLASLFGLAMRQDIISTINLTNPYVEINPHQELLWLMIWYYAIMMVVSLVLVIVRFGAGAILKAILVPKTPEGEKESSGGCPAAKKRQGDKKASGQSAPGATYRIRSSDGGNNNLRTPL